MAKASPARTGAKAAEKTASAPKAAKPAVKKVTTAKAAPAKAVPTAKPGAAVKAIAAKAPKAPVKAAEKPVAKPVAEPKEKARKPKLVRDSFTMPEAEYAVLGEVKKACLKAGIEVKKSELLRVGVSLIRQLDTAKLKEILAGLPALKAGRPKKNK